MHDGVGKTDISLTSLDGLLDHLNVVLLLQGLDQGSADIHGHGSEDALYNVSIAHKESSRESHLLADGAVEDQLDSNSARNTNKSSHGGVSLGITIVNQGAGPRLLGTVLVLNAESVLQHHHVALTRAELHLLLESRAEGVQRVAAGGDVLVGEDSNPAETVDDAFLLLGGLELGLGRNGPREILLAVRGRTQDLLSGLLPGNGGLEGIRLRVV